MYSILANDHKNKKEQTNKKQNQTYNLQPKLIGNMWLWLNPKIRCSGYIPKHFWDDTSTKGTIIFSPSFFSGGYKPVDTKWH